MEKDKIKLLILGYLTKRKSKECKKALELFNNDINEAENYLNNKTIKIINK